MFRPTQEARIAKTIALHEHRDWFEEQLRHDLSSAQRVCVSQGLTPVVRLNVVSDYPWEKAMPWVFAEFPTVVYYDYSKVLKRMLSYCEGKFPSNYHLTFSRSECNEPDCLKVLNANGNVTVVFRKTPFPKNWNGFTVFDGDETDLRFLDPDGVVVGLKAKGTARNDPSGFVVDAEHTRHALPTLAF